MVTYRIRWPFALATSATVPLLLGVFTAVFVHPAWIGTVLGLVLACSFTAPGLARVRSRTLTVSDSGLQVQHDKYMLSAPWDSVIGVERRKLLGVIPVEELSVPMSELMARSSGGESTTLPARLAEDPSVRRIRISFYDKHWRDGPVGGHLRHLG